MLSFEAVQTVATGNPLIVEKINLDSRLAGLNVLLAAHKSQRYRLQDELDVRIPARRAELRHQLRDVTADVNTAENNKAEKFAMTVAGKIYTSREDAGNTLLGLTNLLEKDSTLAAGEYRGLKMEMYQNHFAGCVCVRLRGEGMYSCEVNEAAALGTITRIDHLVQGLPDRLEATHLQLEQLDKTEAATLEELARPFPYEEEMEAGLLRQAELNAQLNLEAQEENTKEEEQIEDEYAMEP
jgi:hypothetical protein